MTATETTTINGILRVFKLHGIIRRFKVDGSDTVLVGLFVPLLGGLVRFYARGGPHLTRITFTAHGWGTKTVVLERGGTKLTGRFI